MMTEPRKWKVFSIQESIDTLTIAHSNMEIHVTLSARLGTALSPLYTIAKNR
jgi:hypothetical protein